jgi:hypothetical protein
VLKALAVKTELICKLKFGIGINTHRNWYHVAGRATIAAVIGGTISDATGGKFANGAITAAFAQLLNAERSAAQRNRLAQMNGPEPLPQKLVNTAVGLGDGVSAGGTRLLREWRGIDGSVDYKSQAYKAASATGSVLSASIGTGMILKGGVYIYAADGITLYSAGMDVVTGSYYSLTIDSANLIGGQILTHTPGLGGRVAAAIVNFQMSTTSAMMSGAGEIGYEK